MLFREGDESNGMYVIRRGKILIFLDKGGNEIPLVTVGEGAMVGEMALFDKKPRSASARALDEVEVTIISNEDFTKILKQIPKWFVTLMATLSSRLRDTNTKLEELEANYKGNYNPFEELSKILHILNLLWYKLGTKELKSWSMEKEAAVKHIANILGLSEEKVTKTMESLIQSGLISEGKNSYKKVVLKIQNRGSIDRFINFVVSFKAKEPSLKEFPQEILDMTETMVKHANRSAYDAIRIPLEDLITEATNTGLRTENWIKMLKIFKDLDDAVQFVEGSGASKIAFKIDKKQIERMLAHCKLLYAITRPQKPQGSPPTKKKKSKIGKAVA